MEQTTRYVEMLLRGSQFKQLMESQVMAIRREYDLKRIEIEVLFYLMRTDKDTLADIYRHLNANKGHISRTMESLKEKGYILPEQDRKDRRYVHYKITEAAEKLNEKIMDSIQEMHQGLFKGLSEEEMRFFEQICEKIGENALSMQNCMKDTGKELTDE